MKVNKRDIMIILSLLMIAWIYIRYRNFKLKMTALESLDKIPEIRIDNKALETDIKKIYEDLNDDLKELGDKRADEMQVIMDKRIKRAKTFNTIVTINQGILTVVSIFFPVAAIGVAGWEAVKKPITDMELEGNSPLI